MARNVAEVMWEMFEKAGVKRCYGIVGDALNPVIDALHRNGKIDFVHVRNEEYGVFAAVADTYFTGKGYTLSMAKQVLSLSVAAPLHS
jgi:pyruvate dehydrogenase (quinone)